jgi:type 1 glutamine amidotransferase
MTGHICLSTLIICVLTVGNAQGAPPKKLLLLAQGPDGHPPQTHEYVAGLQILQRCLDRIPDLEVSLVRADEPWREGPELLGKADGVVIFLSEGAKWLSRDAKRLAAFNELARRKGGIVGLHWGIGTRDAANIEAFVKLLGGCHGGPERKYQVLTKADARITDPKHPITAGIKPFTVRDEFYYRLKFTDANSGFQPILQVPIDGRVETVAWSWDRPDGGRSFGFSGLHFHENWSLPEYRRLAAQGVLWSLRLPIPADGLPVRLRTDDPNKNASRETIPTQQARMAVEHGLAFLDKDAAKWRQERKCATCHHGTMTVWAMAEARSQGYAVASKTLAEVATWTKERLKDIDKARDTRPGWNMVNTPAVYLAIMAEAVPKQDAVSAEDLKRIAGHLVRHQESDGSWAWSIAPAKNRPPPVFESDEVVTLLAYMALGRHVTPDPKEKPAVRAARKNAAAWLKKSKPGRSTQVVALRLLRDVLAGKSPKELESGTRQLLSLQNKDGGWGPRRGTSPAMPMPRGRRSIF